CGGYQLLAHYYRPAEGPDMRGLGVFDAWTIHKGARVPRCIGDIAINWNGSTLVGFENHGGRTYLGTAKPLGKVLKGYGNNAEDSIEGAVYRNTYGTYLHGSLLPKNPHFADYLIGLALQRKYGIGKRLMSNDREERSDSVLYSISTSGNGSRSNESVSEEISEVLTPLDDSLEWEAHATMLERLGLYAAAAAALRRHKGRLSVSSIKKEDT
ncbi:MAG TPA: hypothetical protein VE843_03665, partial [Ktedonobacteraceae bacterium]|nr:hypothetical protein [Ktedonobacteraceae bacterium]